MKKTIKTIFIVSLAIMLMLPVAACAKKETAANGQKELTKVKVSEVTHSIFYAPQYVAISLGYFEEAGIEIELTNAGGADKVMTAVISGEADIGLCGPEQSVYVYNQGNTNFPVNFAQLTKRDGSFIIAREPLEGEFDLSMFTGKFIIGGRKGGMPVMTLEYVLKQNGYEVGADVIVDTSIAFDAMSGAFISGIGDFVTAFEPAAGALEAAGHGYIWISLGALSGDVPYTCFNARKLFINDNKELVSNFVAAIVKGQEYVQTHTGLEVAEAIQEHFPDTSVEAIAVIVDKYRSVDAFSHDPLLTQESFERLLDILDSAGELTGRPPYGELVTTEFLD
ncbi:MAG: ABC transporter substrate-binding protein [Eubacteriaceae bacterium]|nr:ABC transporter substrate-binding protein [Eubacteriaceae bacterium]